MPVISIVTAVHNQLAMNRLFLRKIRQYTGNTFELIVIDNASSDGSADFFEQEGAIVIRNAVNHNYPVCQNQGIAIANGLYHAFLNNDIIVAPNWDEKLIECLEKNALSVVCPAGIEHSGISGKANRYRKRWSVIKTVLNMKTPSEKGLERMHRAMYGNWEKFNEALWKKHGTSCIEGMVGNSVITKAALWSTIGLWDETIQAADFDLFIRCRKRYEEEGDIKPVHLAPGVFHHHYIRLTTKTRPPAFAEQDKMVPLTAKWKQETVDYYYREANKA